ncbi:MAG: UvrD-helicase domain-containing protein [Patescibacteria group bacterium]
MSDILEKLNPPQKRAVTHESGPLLIVAGAGTGKTTVLTSRYLWLLNEKKLTADEIVALTFTEKAAQEMEDRVLEQLPNGAYEFWIHTFHGFCQRILERHGLEIGVPNTFRILSETDAWILLKRRLEELPLDHYRPLGNPIKFLHALIRHISRAKDEGITPDKYVEFAENVALDGDSVEILGSERKRLKELADIYAAYQRILRDEGALDFGDVIMETLRLFRERPALLNKYREQFKHLLIDEFQDTNWAQYELIKMLAEPRRNISVVGDDDQAIYKFRGASLANILQFKDDYPDAVTVALTDNYRSHQNILDTAYKVISNNNPHRLEVSLADQGLSKRLTSHLSALSLREASPTSDEAISEANKLISDEISPLRSNAPVEMTEGDGSPGLRRTPPEDDKEEGEGDCRAPSDSTRNDREDRTPLLPLWESGRGEGAAVDDNKNVTIEWFPSLLREATWVADDIAERHAGQPQDMGWSKFAILVRSNDAALPFVDALANRNIPFRFFALRGLYAKPAIVDVMSLLKLAVNPNDSTTVWRVLTMPCIRVSLKALHEAVGYTARKGISLWEALRQTSLYVKDSPEAVRSVQNAQSLIDKLAESASRETPLAVLHKAINESGYLNQIMSLPERDRIESIGLLNEFVNRIRRFEASTHAPHLKDFVEELEMEIQSGEEGALKSDAETGPDVVRIMTIHASKGLEFETVYMVSMVDQKFPTRARTDAIPLPDGLVQERIQEGDLHIEEERRLCYVAMTRAKRNLIMTGADDYGGARKKKPSIFLTESGIEIPQSPEVDVSDTSLLQPTPKQEEERAALREIFTLKRRFSFTQLVAYKKCPMQYKFAHIYRIPVLGSHQKSFGQSVHLTLQQILKRHLERAGAQQGSLFAPADQFQATSGGLLVTEDEALEIYKECWIDEWYKNRQDHDKYFAEGREAVLRLWHAWSVKLPKVKALEGDFDWRLGEHSIKGKIDRMDEENGGAAIYDYKTSEYKEGDKADALDREQLWLYQMATEAKGQKVTKLAYLFVRAPHHAVQGSAPSVESTGQGCAELEVPLLKDEDKLDFEEDLKRRMDEILISDFPATPSSFLCQYCDFKNICEYRK